MVATMIYVIADDLTGANDTGVQFAKNGFKTVVLIPDLSTKNSISLKKTIKNIKIES
ncbi:MAG: four-carbon acid sugar kinase family protein, partial [bacterium]